MTDQNRYYGWRGPSLPDKRNYLYSAPYDVLDSLPTDLDLRADNAGFPSTLDQSELGACVFNSSANHIRFLQAKEQIPVFLPSRLFMYYNTRVGEGTVDSDAGATIADAVKSMNCDGFPPETDWDYDISKFTQKPPDQAYTDAQSHHAVQYLSVLQDMTQIKGCLASGYPVLVGISVYESFESSQVARTGIVPMPGPQEETLGGHCIMLCGYSDTHQTWLLQNSWGTGWGDSGFFHLPYSYLIDPGLSDDFWTLRLVT